MTIVNEILFNSSVAAAIQVILKCLVCVRHSDHFNCGNEGRPRSQLMNRRKSGASRWAVWRTSLTICKDFLICFSENCFLYCRVIRTTCEPAGSNWVDLSSLTWWHFRFDSSHQYVQQSIRPNHCLFDILNRCYITKFFQFNHRSTKSPSISLNISSTICNGLLRQSTQWCQQRFSTAPKSICHDGKAIPHVYYV